MIFPYSQYDQEKMCSLCRKNIYESRIGFAVCFYLKWYLYIKRRDTLPLITAITAYFHFFILWIHLSWSSRVILEKWEINQRLRCGHDKFLRVPPDKSTTVSIQLKRPQSCHSREGGNPEVIVITNTGFPLSREWRGIPTLVDVCGYLNYLLGVKLTQASSFKDICKLHANLYCWHK